MTSSLLTPSPKRRPYRRRLLTGAAALVVAATGLTSSGLTATGLTASGSTAASRYIGVPPGAAAQPRAHACATATTDCSGTIAVPRDRRDLAGARIPLAFDLFPATDRTRPVRGTVLGIVGGPGGPTDAQAFTRILAPIRDRFNVLVFDQRGTGRSGLLRDCPGLDLERVPSPRQVQACAVRLGTRGEAYGTVAAADDLEDLRRALRIARFDVYGQSYGTFLGQVYTARHPHAVRSLALDGVVGLEHSVIDDTVTGYRWSRRLVATACTRDSACAHVRAPLRTLDRTVRAARAARSADRVGRLLFLTQTMPDQGRADDLVAAAAGYLTGRPADLNTLLATVPEGAVGQEVPEVGPPASPPPPPADDPALAAGVSYALSQSVVCSDYRQPLPPGGSPQQRRQAFVKTVANLPPATFAPFTVKEFNRWPGAFTYAKFCLGWTAPTQDRAFDIPPTSALPAVPTLLLSGEYDMATVASTAEDLAHQLPRATHVLIPGGPHIVTDTVPCAATILTDFVRTLRAHNHGCRA